MALVGGLQASFSDTSYTQVTVNAPKIKQYVAQR